MTGEEGWDKGFLTELGKAHLALVGSAMVLLHSATRVLFAAGGSGEGALALITALDPARLVFTSAVQLASYIVLPATILIALVGVAQRGHRVLAVLAALPFFLVAMVFGSFVMAVTMLSGMVFTLLTLGRFSRLDAFVERPLAPWLAAILVSIAFIGSAMLPVRPLEIIEVSGEPPFVGRVYGQDGPWQMVQIGSHGPLRLLPVSAIEGRQICQPQFDYLSGTFADAFRASGYRDCS